MGHGVTGYRTDFLRMSAHGLLSGVLPAAGAWLAGYAVSPIAVAALSIGPCYTVGWAITLENAIGSKQVQASATYILMRGVGDTLTIVFQIDHQDLAGVIRAQQSVQ